MWLFIHAYHLHPSLPTLLPYINSRYGVRHTLLMSCCIDSVWSRTPRFLTEDLKGMHLPPMSALSLPTELRQEVEATGSTSVFSAFSLNLLLYIQPTRLSMQVLWVNKLVFCTQSTSAVISGWYAGLDITEKRLKLIGRSLIWQVGIISVFVITTLMMTYQVREGLGAQCEQDWPQTEGGWERTRHCQLTQTLHSLLNMTQISEA